jgi:hypothetical protein
MPTNTELASHFAQLTDEELLSRYASNTLTEEAGSAALREIRRRGLNVPPKDVDAMEALGDNAYAGDFKIVARFLEPMNAYVMRSYLEAAGVPVLVTDDQLTQVYSLWAVAIGGARVMVSAGHVAEAREVIKAFHNGDLAIGEDDILE